VLEELLVVVVEGAFQRGLEECKANLGMLKWTGAVRVSE